jgi:hypothetical protein
VNPFTRALGPPFIGIRRDFYILRLPSNLENISSVNMCMNVFYIPWFAGLIPYIYKPATSSHFKPGLLRWCLWLGLPLISEGLLVKIITYQDSRNEILKIPEFRRFLISCETNSRPANQKPIRLLSSHNIRRLANCMKFIRMSSRTFPCHETKFSTLRHIHDYIHEFGNFDVSRVKGFCPIPQHPPLIGLMRIFPDLLLP